MKKLKQIFAVILSLAMVLGMSLTTFAYGSLTLTINEVASTDTFEYLQVIEPDNTTATGWKFANESIGKNYTDAFSITADEKIPSADDMQKAIWMLIKYQTDNAPGMPEDITKATDSQIAEALDKVADSSYGLTTTGDGKQVTVNSPGVYYIKGTDSNANATEKYTYSPMTAYVSFNYNADGVVSNTLTAEPITAKKAKIKVDKEADDQDKIVYNTQDVEYKVSATVPYVPANENNRYYIVSDTMTGGKYAVVTEDGENEGKLAVTVKIGSGKEAYNKVHYVNVTSNNQGNSFNLDLTEILGVADPDDNQYPLNYFQGKDISISYHVIVDGTIVDNTINIGKAENETNPSYGSDDEKVYTGKITLTKYSSDNDNDNLEDNKKLAGAKFKVYKKDNAEKKTYATFDTDGMFTGWADQDDDATVVETKQDGTLVITGLDVGTYWFEETEAPEGYSVNKEDVSATLSQEGEATAVITAETHMIDTTLSALPSTGGIGTTIFTIGGCAIMIIAAALFFASRRKSVK